MGMNHNPEREPKISNTKGVTRQMLSLSLSFLKTNKTQKNSFKEKGKKETEKEKEKKPSWLKALGFMRE